MLQLQPSKLLLLPSNRLRVVAFVLFDLFAHDPDVPFDHIYSLADFIDLLLVGSQRELIRTLLLL